MKAAFLTGIRQLAVRDVPEPRLTSPREVLLSVAAVGVCGSDLHYYTTGRIGCLVVEYPFLVGHECAGTVWEAGAEATGLRVGQRVAVDPLVSCGECDQCLQGRRHTCRKQGFLGCPGQLPGALAEYLVMPAECCYPIPDSMSFVEAVLVEPLSIGLYAAHLAGLEPGAKIGILGSGPIGLCVLLAARAAVNCTAYVTDLVDERLEVARRCGADWTGNPERQDVVAAVEEREPLGLDVVFECAGEQETLDQALRLLKPAGTLHIVGIPPGERISFNIDLLRRKELRVQNVRRQNQCMGRAIEMLVSGKVNADPLATHHFSLAESQAAFDLVAARRDGVVKAVIHVSR